MNTFEARTHMRDLAHEALAIVNGVPAGRAPTSTDRRRLREMSVESRDVLVDAGFPGEGVWRGLQRASIAVDTFIDVSDDTFWADVALQLTDGIETLDALLSPVSRRDTDFTLVG